MLTVQEGCLVPGASSVKPVRGVPTLFRRHPAKPAICSGLVCSFRQHEIRVLQAGGRASSGFFRAGLADFRVTIRLENEQTVYITTPLITSTASRISAMPTRKSFADVIAVASQPGQEVFF